MPSLTWRAGEGRGAEEGAAGAYVCACEDGDVQEVAARDPLRRPLGHEAARGAHGGLPELPVDALVREGVRRVQQGL